MSDDDYLPGLDPVWLAGEPPAEPFLALREARRQLRRSQASMAGLLGVSLRTYEGWEAGRTPDLWPTVARTVALYLAVLVGEEAGVRWWRGVAGSA